MTESLLHGLIEKAVLSVADAVDIVETAVSVQQDAIAASGDPDGTTKKSLLLLEAISKSLSHDLIVDA